MASTKLTWKSDTSKLAWRQQPTKLSLEAIPPSFSSSPSSSSSSFSSSISSFTTTTSALGSWRRPSHSEETHRIGQRRPTPSSDDAPEWRRRTPSPPSTSGADCQNRRSPSNNGQRSGHRPLATFLEQERLTNCRGLIVWLPKCASDVPSDNPIHQHPDIVRQQKGHQDDPFNHPCLCLGTRRDGRVELMQLTGFGSDTVANKYAASRQGRMRYLLISHPGIATHDNLPIVKISSPMAKPTWVNTYAILHLDPAYLTISVRGGQAQRVPAESLEAVEAHRSIYMKMKQRHRSPTASR